MLSDYTELIAKCILFLLGWKYEVSKDMIQKLNKKDRVILIFPHSSYFDFFLMLLYSSIYKRHVKHEICTLIQPGIFRYFGKILRRLGGIPAGSVHEKGQTFKKIKEELNSKENFIFLISPKGRRNKGEWRNGYYYLAKELVIPILPAGLNYCTHSIEFGNYFIMVDDYPQRIIYLTPEEVKSTAISVIKTITPLHPERSEFGLNKYDTSERGIISINRISALMVILSVISLYYYRFIYLTLLVMTMFSWRLIRTY